MNYDDNEIDPNRYETHKIYDIAEKLGQSASFTRNCHFSYKLDKK